MGLESKFDTGKTMSGSLSGTNLSEGLRLTSLSFLGVDWGRVHLRGRLFA